MTNKGGYTYEDKYVFVMNSLYGRYKRKGKMTDKQFRATLTGIELQLFDDFIL